MLGCHSTTKGSIAMGRWPAVDDGEACRATGGLTALATPGTLLLGAIPRLTDSLGSEEATQLRNSASSGLILVRRLRCCSG
jgi:hypothetical protein